jgi:hypothetical protein
MDLLLVAAPQQAAPLVLPFMQVGWGCLLANEAVLVQLLGEFLLWWGPVLRKMQN